LIADKREQSEPKDAAHPAMFTLPARKAVPGVEPPPLPEPRVLLGRILPSPACRRLPLHLSPSKPSRESSVSTFVSRRFTNFVCIVFVRMTALWNPVLFQLAVHRTAGGLTGAR